MTDDLMHVVDDGWTVDSTLAFGKELGCFCGAGPMGGGRGRRGVFRKLGRVQADVVPPYSSVVPRWSRCVVCGEMYADWANHCSDFGHASSVSGSLLVGTQTNVVNPKE